LSLLPVVEHGPVYLSSGAFRDQTIQNTLELSRRWGVVNVELGSGIPFHADTLSLISAEADNFNFLAHNYFPAPEEPFVLNLASLDDANLERSRAHCRHGLEITAQLGAPFYAAHAGYLFDPRPEELGHVLNAPETTTKDKCFNVFLESVSALLDFARSFGVGFLVENNVCAPFNAPDGVNDKLLLTSPDEILEFAEALNAPDFGLLMDVGHLKVSAHTLGFDCDEAMTQLQHLIRAFHLSDNDGSADQNLGFSSDAWFLPWLGKIPSVPITIEAYNMNQDDYAQCLAAIGQARPEGR